MPRQGGPRELGPYETNSLTAARTRNTMKYTAIVYEAEDGGFWATCAEVPEANGQGETREQAIDDLKSAIELVVEYKREHGQRLEPAQLFEIDVA